MIQWGLPQNSSTTLMIIPNSDSGCAAYIAFHNISWLPFAFFRQASCQEKQLRWIHRCIYYPPCPPPSSQSLVLRTSKSDFVKLCDLPNHCQSHHIQFIKTRKKCEKMWKTLGNCTPAFTISPNFMRESFVSDRPFSRNGTGRVWRSASEGSTTDQPSILCLAVLLAKGRHMKASHII